MTSDFKKPRVKFKDKLDTGWGIQLNETNQSVFFSFWHVLVLNEYYLDNKDDGGNDAKHQMSCKDIKTLVGIKKERSCEQKQYGKS